MDAVIDTLLLAALVFHRIALADLATTRHTHVCVTAPVTYVRKQADGDYHVTLDDGRAKVVAEIIPAIPLPAPRKGDRVEVCGISRIDRHHGWAELHPVLRLTVTRPRR